MTLALLCAVNFMVILDAQIVLLGIPPIQHRLGFSPGGVQWVISAYLIAFGGLLLLGGRAADLIGRRRVFLVGTALFGLSSLICGIAWSPAVLVAGRGAQGVSAAAMAPAGLAILTTTYSEGVRRDRALALWGGAGGTGATAALLIGGALVGAVGWRAIFLLNVPIAAAMLALAPVLLPESRDRDRRRDLDASGGLLVTAAMALLVTGVVRATAVGWSSAETVGTLLGAAGAGLGFVAVERRAAVPLVPLRVFRSRSLVAGNLTMLIAAMVAFGVSLTVSLYAQNVLGYSALRFGVATTAMTVMTLVGSFVAQALARRTGLLALAAGGMVLMGVGSGLLARVHPAGTYAGDLLPGLLVFGLGLGAGPVAASIAALAGGAERDAGVASGTNTAAFQIGGALGASIATAVAAAHGGAGVVAATGGYRAAFTTCAVLTAVGLLATPLLRASVGSTERPRPRDPSQPRDHRHELENRCNS